jgi:hypothetical protein
MPAAAPAVGSFKTCSRRSRGSICGKKNFTIKACLLREGFLAPTNAEVRINNNQTTTENSNWI